MTQLRGGTDSSPAYGLARGPSGITNMEGMAVADERKAHCDSGSVAFSILESVAW
jgi:hypothetical protein